MQQIELAKYNFNVDDIVKGAAEIKGAIDEIKRDQKELTKDNKTSSLAYVENAANLKVLNAEYSKHIKALAETSTQAQETTLREAKLEIVLGQEVKTIKEAREQNKLLNDLRNNSNLKTAEGIAQLKQLNDQLDANNEFIKENVDQYTQQKINIGNYKDSVKEALNEVNLFNGGVGNLSQNFGNLISKSQEAGGAGNLLKTSLGGATQGLAGLTKASLSFIATPVGAIIAVLVGAFLLIKNTLDRNEESMNKLKRAFAPFEGILNAILSALEPVGEFLIDGIVAGMELAEKAIFKLQESFAVLLDFLGFDKQADSLRAYSQHLKDGSENAKQLADAEANLQSEQRKARLTQLKYMKDAESFRQIRDDERKSMPERIEANRQLGAILEQQLQEELRIAQIAVEVANKRLIAEGQTTANKDAQLQALTEIADIEERINGQRSEQLTNEVSLRKEASDKAREIADKRIEKMNQELELYISQQGIRARTLQEELSLEEEVSKRRLKILEAELKAKAISQAEYETAIQDMKNASLLAQAEILSQNALLELDIFRDTIKKKQEEEVFLSSEVAQIRKDLNDNLLLENERYELLRLEQGLINQTEYDRAIRELTEANRIANAEVDAEREQVEREEQLELRALEFEAEMSRLLEEKASEFVILKAQADEQRRLEEDSALADREKGLISEELYRKRLDSIDRRYNEAEEDRSKALKDQKLDMVSGYLDKASQVIDENSKVGKLIALAKAGINTYEGITAGVALGFPQAIPAVAFAAATGFKAVKDILKTKVPSASGRGNADGGGGGSIPSSSGGLGSVNLSGRGVNLTQLASNNSSVQNQIENNASMQNMAQDVGRAVEMGAERGAGRGAQDGITNLTGNQRIINDSTF